ncbi:MAG: AAA family ATPase [Acidimicrobiia bacterium]|nr:AAA family ATPase [Acidimicrobiia bacterium]
MRISGLHINGFGMFADYRLNDLPSGLTVLCGPNEAGKSTLVNYVLSILFGFPDGRSKGPHHEPLVGGNHGGKLFLRDGDSEYIIERTKAGKVPMVRYPGGGIGGQEAIKDLLGNADRTLFQNVFAFGLKELEDLKALEGDSVRERIFATPTFGGGPSAREIINQLESREKELFRPRSDSTITDLRRKLEDVHGGLQALQGQAKSYEQATRDLDEAIGAVESISADLREKRQEAKRYETLIEIWPQWSDRLAAEREAESLQVPDGVELASEARLRDAEREIGERNVAVRERKDSHDRQQSRFNKVNVDDLLPPAAAQAKKLHAEIRRYDTDRTRLGTLETRIENLQTDVSRSLTELGPGWDKDRVEAFDTSIPIKGKLVEWRDQLSEADKAIANGVGRVAGLEGGLEEATTERRDHEQKLAEYATTPSAEEIEAAESKTRKMRVLGEEVGKLRERVRADDERVAAVQEVLESVGRPTGAGVPPSILFAVPVVLGGAGVVAGVANEFLSAVLLLVLAVASGVGIVLWRRAARTAGGDTASGTRSERPTAGDAPRRELEAAQSEARDLAAELGFAEIPNASQIEERLAAITLQRIDRSAADALANLVDGERTKERKLREQIEAATRELEEQRSGRRQLGSTWDDWRTEQGIAEPLKPEVVMDLVPAIAGTRELIRQESEARSEASDVRQRIKWFEQSATETLKAAERDDDLIDSGLMAAVEALYQDILEDEKKRESIVGLKKGIGGAREDLEEAEADLANAEAIRDRVLAEVGVADAAALDEAIGKLKRRAELEADAAKLSRLIETAIGGGEGGELMKEELTTGDLSRWQSSYDEASALVEELEQEHEVAVRHHQDLKTAAAAIAGSTEVAKLALVVEAQRVELAEATAEWARVATARALIDATLARFERKHQPKVVERAAELFNRITDGRYPELLSTESDLKVMSRASDPIDIVDLSTGTVQQLYLCLRFALAEEFAGRGVKLPLVMDDVLVNFDPERAASVAGVISELAEQHQVVLLTCHPGTRDLMAGSAPEARIVELKQFPL